MLVHHYALSLLTLGFLPCCISMTCWRGAKWSFAKLYGVSLLHSAAIRYRKQVRLLRSVLSNAVCFGCLCLQVLYDLYRLTGKEMYAHTARLFDKPAVFDPLEQNRDALGGLHANTHLAQVGIIQRSFCGTLCQFAHYLAATGSCNSPQANRPADSQHSVLFCSCLLGSMHIDIRFSVTALLRADQRLCGTVRSNGGPSRRQSRGQLLWHHASQP